AKIPLVMRNPEPHVEFLRFGPYSLDFELRFFLADMGDGMAVRNNLRIEILKRFRAEGIEIPLPQTDLTIHREARPALADGGRDQPNEQENSAVTPMEEEEQPVRQLRSNTADGNRKG
ncbi:mechanosensitive ion channel family protein, partial [Rhizobium ruizarguesonis]